jgi:hypothetical protein
VVQQDGRLTQVQVAEHIANMALGGLIGPRSRQRSKPGRRLSLRT